MATKQRANGEGSICLRADGRWMARATLPSGKRKYFYGSTRESVRDQLTTALSDIKKGLPVVTERQTVAQYLARWLEISVAPSVRPKTYSSYEQLVRVHITPSIDRYQLQKLAPQHVQAMLGDKQKAGLSPRTVQYIRAVLRKALNQALKWGLVSRNVATLVDVPRSVRHIVTALTEDDADSLLAAVRGDRFEALYCVALGMGLRQGEVLGLRWSDIDLEKRVLTVKYALQRVHGEVTFVEPKTTLSRRSLPIPLGLITVFDQHRAEQRQDQLLTGAKWQEHGMVFASTIGTPLDRTYVTHRLQTLLQRAGLPHMRFQDLRHGCATLLRAMGVSLLEIKDILGHSQISLTANTYTHVVPTMRRDALDKMDAVFQRRTAQP